jgi:hypothetical protein
MNPTDTRLGLLPAPEGLAKDARAWIAPLLGAASGGVRALYLYGSALSPGFDPAVSDVNLLLVVDTLDFRRLDALARAGRDLPVAKPGTTQHTPIVLTESQIVGGADVFPIDTLDLIERRALLEGTDVLATLAVERGNLRHQCEYELRSKLIGLRQGFLRAGGADGVAHELTARAQGGSAALYRHLLSLAGKPRPDDASAGSVALAQAVGAAFGIAPEALAAPFAARKDSAPDEKTARARFAAYLDALEALTRKVDEDAAR